MRRYLKVFCFLLAVLFLFALSGCGGLSDDELDSAIEDYRTALQQLCNDYGLNDAEIEVESNLSGEKIGDTFHYIGTSEVSSEKFSQLSGAEAFSFMKEFEHLENGLFDYENASISYIAHVNCKSGRYTYESKRTSLSTFEYLMRYGNAAVTYQNGKLVYDIF